MRVNSSHTPVSTPHRKDRQLEQPRRKKEATALNMPPPPPTHGKGPLTMQDEAAEMACAKEILECAANMSIPCFEDMVKGIDPSVVNVLAIVGGLVLLRSALCLAANVFATFLRPGKNLKKYGAWAVVTGATGERACLAICLTLSRVCLWRALRIRAPLL